MKRFALMALASGLAIAAATPASAAVVIGVGVNGGAVSQVATDGGTGSASYVATVGGFNFNIGGTGFPLLTRPDLLTQSITVQQAGAAAGTVLNIYVTQTDNPSFNGLLTSSFTSNTQMNTDATIRSFFSSTNALFGGTQLQSATFLTGPNLFVGSNPVVANGPFSTTVRYDITFSSTEGDFNGTGNIRGTAVPEPATWGMMIMGFGLLGGVMRRRKTTVAFA